MLTESIIALILVGICLIIHIGGIIGLAIVLVGQRRSIEKRFGLIVNPLVLIGVFTVLMVLHIAENCIWAAFYTWRGLFGNFETSLYFSLSTYTTIGYGDVLLPEKWRLLGALEGISGVLLCGLSTAFFFAVVHGLFRFGIQRMIGKKRVLNPGPTSHEAEQ